jgi:8-oxo-dGTP pyrophosphatase MutT (NUDIX family)
MKSTAYQDFINRLQQSLKLPMPGADAQFRLVPPSRKSYPEMNPDNVRLGAVLALFFPEGDSVRLVFIQRQNYLGVHSGQISFPGGGYEEQDQTFDKTAIRETNEEIGIPENDIRILGELSTLYIPPSNFLVHTFAGFIEYYPTFHPDPAEVSEVFSIPIEELLDADCFQTKAVKAGETIMTVPCYFTQNRMIWGATAMILSELLEVIERAG